MSVERKRVLEMLADGKITAADAERLLDKLQASAADASFSDETPGKKSDAKTKKLKYLRIVVEEPGDEQVNVRVPLTFLRGSAKLWNILPERVTERLAEHGIGIAGIAALRGKVGEDLAGAIEDLNVDVEKPNGKKVRIFCEWCAAAK